MARERALKLFLERSSEKLLRKLTENRQSAKSTINDTVLCTNSFWLGCEIRPWEKGSHPQGFR
jgi:hypothetical protein